MSLSVLGGNVVPELVKDAPANPGYASQVRRVRDRAACGLVSAPDLGCGSDLGSRPVAGASAGAAAPCAASVSRGFSTNTRELADCFGGARSARGGGCESVPDDSGFSGNSADDAAAHATAGVSDSYLGVRQVIESHSGVARARSASSAAVAPCAAAVALTCPLASGAVVAVNARNTVTPMHVGHTSGEGGGLLPVQRSTCYKPGWRWEGSHGNKEYQRWEVNFRPAGSVRGQVAGSLPRKATRHRYQACQGRCGHTFPPPGCSCYPIRVTWIRIGHRAINGLDEGV